MTARIYSDKAGAVLNPSTALPNVLKPLSVIYARRSAPRALPPLSAPSTRSGIAYERRVVAALRATYAQLEHNPTFAYATESLLAPSFCIPDAILWRSGEAKRNLSQSLDAIEAKAGTKLAPNGNPLSGINTSRVSAGTKCDLPLSGNFALSTLFETLPPDVGAIVIEVKLTYVPEAMQKLTRVYIPVVEKFAGFRALPLVIVKKLIPGSPLAAWKLRGALATPYPLVHWLGAKHLPLE